MKKLTHYSRTGYNGDLTYTSVCKKNVGTHGDKETVSMHPIDTDCKECLSTLEYKNDLSSFNITKPGFKRRIYIESDILKASELSTARRSVRRKSSDEIAYEENVFNDVLDFAWHDLEKTWAAVKLADEIYLDNTNTEKKTKF